MKFLFKFSSESIARSGIRLWAADSRRTPRTMSGPGSPEGFPRTLRQGDPEVMKSRWTRSRRQEASHIESCKY